MPYLASCGELYKLSLSSHKVKYNDDSDYLTWYNIHDTIFNAK